MQQHKNRSKHIKRHIQGRKKEITILFTDIVASVKHWDSHGDVVGRMMIDTHNRLIFPIIKKFRGKLVKTIGDALMLSFKKPVNAVKAATAIQQALQIERQKNKKFPKVRIGIHTGHAIVEKGDVFGDMVNIASRIESRARGDEILLSTRTARKMSQKKCHLEKKGKFTPKGKKTAITLYKCHWKKAPSLIENIKLGSRHILNRRQRWEILGAILASIFILAVMYFRYIRYLLSDSETIALLTLNPLHMIIDVPWIAAILAILLALIIYSIFKMKGIPIVFFKILHGGLGFCIAFLLLYAPITFLSINVAPKILHTSNHLFVEIDASSTPIRKNPVVNSTILRTVPRGMLLLLADVEDQGALKWNKVLIDWNEYGWVLRVIPPKLGVPEKRVSTANKFYFRVRDIFFFIAGVLGFIWGFYRFKIKPA